MPARLAHCSHSTQLAIDNLKNWSRVLPTIFDSHQNCTEHNFIFQNKGFLLCFFPTFCASNRAPDRFFSRATFCASNRASDGCFLVQLFALQIVLQIGLLACNFLCSKSCSRWVFLRAFFLVVRSLENISWFHFARCSPLSLLAMTAKVNSSFRRPRYLAAGWTSRKKCAAHAAFVSLIFADFFVLFFVV